MDTASEKITRRATVESTYSEARDAIEKQYIVDRNQLEKAYHAALKANRNARATALRAAGLNPDGSDPQGRPVG